MRVKSIVIDGFKSYAHRKEIADLSPHFNAITGLNGSGKSNIFDAICFVMGITNLKRVRAEDPRELIFRAGTTGVHAARVTIEFVNDDPASAPPGYSCEDFPIITIGRQIKVGGKQQFFFNNTVSMQSKVKRFFESISLNVDNPHFMVLQGTVHKLIGMRSQDILSLVEEAVGTKAFDHRRRTAETLIRNKEKKMEEIDNNIETQIGPLLEAMKSDQEEYHRYLSVTEGLEERRRFAVAFEYYNRSNQLRAQGAREAEVVERISTSKEQLKLIPQQEEGLTRHVMQLQGALEGPSEAAVALHEEEGELKKQQSRYASLLDGCNKHIKQLEQQLRLLQKEKESHAKGYERFAGRREQREALLNMIKDERDNVNKLKQAVQLTTSGIRAGASGVSLEAEKSAIDRDLIHLEAAVTRSQEKVAQMMDQLERAQRNRVRQAGTLNKLSQDVAASTSALADLQTAYTPIANLEERCVELQAALTSARERYLQAYESFQREHAGRSFELEFDRRACPDVEQKIFGRVADVVYPKETKYTTALLVGAQSQLMRVVVKDDQVAETVIRHGLRQRTAFLALSHLQRPRPIDPGKLHAARRIAEQRGGFVFVASELTTLRNPSLMAVSEYVFGNFLVCSDLTLAQELAYNPSVGVKAVSLDGELAEPSGLISGGSTSQLRDVFAELKAYRTRMEPVVELRQRVSELDTEYQALWAQLQRNRPTLDAYKAAEEELDLAKQRLQVAQGSSKQAIGDVEEQLRQTRRELQEMETNLCAKKKRRKDIEKEANMDPDCVQKDLEEQLIRAQANLARLVKEEEADAAEFERLEADTEQQANDLESKLLEATEDLKSRQRERDELQGHLNETNGKLVHVLERCRHTEEQRQRIEKEIEEAQAELSRCSERKATIDTLLKNAEVDIRDVHKSMEELKKAIRDDERRHSWIEQERELFGSVDSPFYFDDAGRTTATLQELREAEAHVIVMSKRMNKKATILYEDRKREYDELVKQRAALGEDKEAIQVCILEIEKKKWHALDRMVGVVSSIFGKLFSVCLPGATAELVEERDNYQHLCGLGVRVLLNGKPKESLSELSGGQRSLLALCLVLAILRVRQAPIYILDEVDAALDPSHTQNIGRMLQLYFPHSQFLLVSLKDGMFNNANVLYHIRNTQGYSEVTRIEHRGTGNFAVDESTEVVRASA